MIPQRNISTLSNRLANAGGRRIPEAVLERDYCIAWMLVGIARSQLSQCLAFKGGTALKRCYFGDYRFSEDLDFSLLPGATLDQVLAEFPAAFKHTHGDSGISASISRSESMQGQNSYTFYIAYDGPLPATNRPKEIKCDITLTEAIVFPLAKKRVLQAYPEFTDLTPIDEVTIYSLNEIATEKTLAVLDQARTEPRDLYDLSFLTSEGINIGDLKHAIIEKLKFRNRTLEEVSGNLQRKEARFRAAWQPRLGNQMSILPHYEDTFRDVQRSLRQAGILPN